MKKAVVILVISICLIVVNNLPPIRWLYHENDCNFSNSDGSYTFSEMSFKGTNYQICQEVFEEFKKKRAGDTLLFRLCPKNALHFWDYGQYLFAEKYRLPYKPWREIEAKRGPIINKSGFQDF